MSLDSDVLKELDEMPKESDAEKIAYKTAILNNMRLINSIDSKKVNDAAKDEAIILMSQLLYRYKTDFPNFVNKDDLSLKIKAFNDKYHVELITGDKIEDVFGKRIVNKPDGSEYKRWGGKKTRKYKTFAKKSRKNKGKRSRKHYTNRK
jgi:hypothetical protein